MTAVSNRRRRRGRQYQTQLIVRCDKSDKNRWRKAGGGQWFELSSHVRFLLDTWAQQVADRAVPPRNNSSR